MPERNQARHLIFAWLVAVNFALSPVMPGVVTRGGTLVVAFAMLFGWHGRGTLSREAKLVYAGFVVYVAMALLSLLNNENWHFAGWRFEKYYPFVSIGFVFVFLSAMPRALSARALLLGLGAGTVGMAILAVASQVILDIQRVGDLTGLDKNIFGNIAYSHAAVLFAAIPMIKTPRWRNLGLAAAVLGVYAGISSGSRGALLAFGAAMIVVGFFQLRHLRGNPRLLRSWSIVATLLVVSMGALIAGSDFWRGQWGRIGSEVQQFQSKGKENTSVGSRLAMWQAAGEIWARHPVIGTGFGDGEDELKAMVDAGRISPQAVFFHFHNIYAESLATTGTLGFLSMLTAIFVLPFWFFRRVIIAAGAGGRERFVAVAGMALLASQFVFGLTNGWLYLRGLPHDLVLFVLLMSISVRFADLPGKAAAG